MHGTCINPLNAELHPIRNLLALVGAGHIVHVSRIRVNMIARLPSRVHYCGRYLCLTGMNQTKKEKTQSEERLEF